MKAVMGLAVGLVVSLAQMATANGGPFIVKYPGGDPAAKGVLARLDPSLKPAAEERLKVLYENLSIDFVQDKGPRFAHRDAEPLVAVKAEYRIANPVDGEVEVDFGFPVLRGIFVSPWAMNPRPDVRVTMDGKEVESRVISTSAIYGMIRDQAHREILAGVAGDAPLAGFLKALKSAGAADRAEARAAVMTHLGGTGKWNGREAGLLADFAVLNVGTNLSRPVRFGLGGEGDPQLYALASANLGSLAAIGEQKATQLLALLAGKFNAAAVADYEGLFKAWGGDVRERSIDLAGGKIRPREFTLSPEMTNNATHGWRFPQDPTVYARVDYLDARIPLPEEQTAALKRVLKELPVTFTFAPMNLIYYRVKFQPMSEQTVTVQYAQYAYADTAAPESYQLAYVLHPASFWKEFGRIHLSIRAPDAVRLLASVPLTKKGAEEVFLWGRQMSVACYEGEVKEKTGELFVGLSKSEWTAWVMPPAKPAEAERAAK